ncbi:MAG: hypothetical protein E6G78_22555 [Alphaproteobacteria bacterium]|nr:MAG: hypothetical protein E6G78_22555 [Alphaproteobacteria bacterium]
MTDFVIDPPIRILGRRGSFVRSTSEAAAFIRQHMDRNARKVLHRLEGARSAKQAQEAAQAFRSWVANRLPATSGAASKASKMHPAERAGRSLASSHPTVQPKLRRRSRATIEM